MPVKSNRKAASPGETTKGSSRSKPIRTRSGRGTITRLPSGLVRAHVTVDGARLGETFATVKECDDWIDQQLSRVNEGGPLDGPRTKVSELLRRLLDVCRTRGLAVSTVRIYTWAGDYVRAAFGDTPVGDLTTAKLDAFDATLKKGAPRLRADGTRVDPAPLGAKSIGHVHGLLSAMLNQAIDWKLISDNVTQRAKRPKVPKHRHAYWTPPQIVEFLEAIQGERLEAAFWVMLTCGLRRGELCGLRDEDLRQVTDPLTGEPLAVLSVHRKLHELRHSFARALLAANESSKAVQQALGRATHAKTVDLYGDMILGTERQVARTIGRILDSKKFEPRHDKATPQ